MPGANRPRLDRALPWRVRPIRVSVRSSAAIDRHGSGVFPHSTACIEFAPNSGLWAFAAFADDAAREKWSGPLKGAIRLLADSGFGGERSRGWGRAEVSFSDDPLPFASWGSAMRCPPDDKAPLAAPLAESAWWMLSLFHPPPATPSTGAEAAIPSPPAAAASKALQAGAMRKKPTRMIAEGSVIVAAAEPRGSASNVAPDHFPHPVYRAGFALAVPISPGPAGRPIRMKRSPDICLVGQTPSSAPDPLVRPSWWRVP